MNRIKLEGQRVADIQIEGKNLGIELLQKGLAWCAKGNSQLDYENFEKTARANKLGLWSAPNPVPAENSAIENT